MAQIIIDIPAGVTTRVLNAIAVKYGYQETLPAGTPEEPTTIPNPETKAQFAKRMVIKHVKDIVREYEASQAQTAAFNSAATTADNEITIT